MGRPALPVDSLAPGSLRKNPARAIKRTAEPDYPPLDPEPPENFDEFEKEKWHYHFKLLNDQGVITAADRDTLASYCTALCDVDKIRATIERDGWTIGDKLNPKPHPLCTALNQARGSAIAVAAQLGVTPASRNRTRGISKKDDSAPKNGFEEI